jgi:hypothetical protein
MNEVPQALGPRERPETLPRIKVEKGLEEESQELMSRRILQICRIAACRRWKERMLMQQSLKLFPCLRVDRDRLLSLAKVFRLRRTAHGVRPGKV